MKVALENGHDEQQFFVYEQLPCIFNIWYYIYMVIDRWAKPLLEQKLQSFPAVALLGPRQMGKTTLALEIAAAQGGMYLDLERPADANRLADPDVYLRSKLNNFLVLDEVQRNPELFPVLRGVIDEQRRVGIRNGSFLLLGSASQELIGAASETLPGRLAFVELTPITPAEAAPTGVDQDQVLVRGGFPDSLLAQSDSTSLQWRQAFIRSFLDREVPMFAPRISTDTLSRLWQMIAHSSGGLLNSANLAGSLGISNPTIDRYLDLLSELGMIRLLRPWSTNVGKRVVKSPKVFIRDTGIAHALLGIETLDELRGHPVIGSSFESLVIESVITSISTNLTSTSWEPYFYRTSNGAEIDLLLTRGGKPEIAIEVKNSSTPKLTRGFHTALQDLDIKRTYVVYSGTERYIMQHGVEAISLIDLQNTLHNA